MAGGQGQPAAVRHRVARVEGGVEQGGLELGEVDLDRRQRRREIEHDLELPAERAPDHFGEGVEAQVEIGHFGLQRLPPAEGEQVAGQGRRAIGGVEDRLEVAGALLLAEPGPGREARRSRG